MFFLFDDALLYGAILSSIGSDSYKYGLMINLSDGKGRFKDLRDTPGKSQIVETSE